MKSRVSKDLTFDSCVMAMFLISDEILAAAGAVLGVTGDRGVLYCVIKIYGR